MSLTLALVINVIAMLSLIAGLAFVMSRAALLTPHRGTEARAFSRGLQRKSRVRSRPSRVPAARATATAGSQARG
jgi:hypothetical protein